MSIVRQIFSSKKPSKSVAESTEVDVDRYAKIIQQLRGIINNLSHPIFAIEPDGTIFFMSRGVALEFDRKIPEFIGKKFVDVIPLEPNKKLHETLTKLIEQKNEIIDELYYGDKVFELIVNPILDVNKQTLSGAVFEMKDLTEVKEFEQRQIDFVGYISHELRTPISNVKGYLDVVLHEADYLTAEHRRFLERANRSNDRQEVTVENLIELSDLERGHFVLHQEKVDIVKLCSELTKTWQSDAEQKGLSFQVVFPKFTIPPVLADRELLIRVLTNLISNAIKYTAQGSVKIEFEFKSENIFVHVVDTGKGIPLDAQAKIFEKFVRGEHSLTETTQGSGLGLYLTKQYVEQMGGQLELVSEEGAGSKFTFSLKPSSA